MSDRNLAHYEEPRNEYGPHWTLDIDRSASGQPGLVLTIRFAMHDSVAYSHLDREMTIVVDDGNDLLAPVLEWLGRA